MARTVISGLIQASNPINDESKSVAEVQAAMLEKHLPMIHDAGKKGVQILCLQEIFNGPYFCPGQDKRWYDAAEPVPGPTVEKLAPIAAKYQMAMVVPSTSASSPAVYYKTRRSSTRMAATSGRTEDAHPQTSVLGEVLLRRPTRHPVFKPLRHERRVHLLLPPLPRGRTRASRLASSSQPVPRRRALEPFGDRARRTRRERYYVARSTGRHRSTRNIAISMATVL